MDENEIFIGDARMRVHRAALGEALREAVDDPGFGRAAVALLTALRERRSVPLRDSRGTLSVGVLGSCAVVFLNEFGDAGTEVTVWAIGPSDPDAVAAVERAAEDRRQQGVRHALEPASLIAPPEVRAAIGEYAGDTRVESPLAAATRTAARLRGGERLWRMPVQEGGLDLELLYVVVGFHPVAIAFGPRTAVGGEAGRRLARELSWLRPLAELIGSRWTS
jgi:hypothetical protein